MTRRREAVDYENLTKIVFTLEQDEDGYPPESRESIWAKPLQNGNFILDGIPFFATEVSDGDEVAAAPDPDGLLIFGRLIKPSPNCTVRVIMFEKQREDEVREHLSGLKCEIEGTGINAMFALSVHRERYNQVEDYLRHLFENDVLDYEESAIR